MIDELSEFKSDRLKADDSSESSRAFQQKWFGKYPQFDYPGASLYRRSEQLLRFLERRKDLEK